MILYLSLSDLNYSKVKKKKKKTIRKNVAKSGEILYLWCKDTESQWYSTSITKLNTKRSYYNKLWHNMYIGQTLLKLENFT
jgi:hypothetical protein